MLEPHALQACWDAQLAGLSADALNLALEHGVFAHLDQFIAADELALVLKWDADNSAYLLELLWSLDLLECQWTCPRRYRNLPQTARYLNPGSAHYCGDALLFRHGVLRQVGNQL
ncbi:O-methyltransferase, partial [Alcaligenes pakistanensis]